MNAMTASAAINGEAVEQLTFLHNALADKQDGMTEEEVRGLSRMLGHIIRGLPPNRKS